MSSPENNLERTLVEIRFPALLYLESRMGKLQVEIMEKFPDVNEIRGGTFLLYKPTETSKEDDLSKMEMPDTALPKWEFKTQDNKWTISVTKSNLVIETAEYTSYDSFKETLDYAIKKFLDVMELRVINRIGVRYINKIDITKMESKDVYVKYHSVFPQEDFNVEQNEGYQILIVQNIEEFILRYREFIETQDEKRFIVLDLDGISMSRSTEGISFRIDKIHDLIREKYNKFVKYEGE